MTPSKAALDVAAEPTSATRPPILMIGNNKGGVFKTGTVVQLAAALARKGLRVLVIDFDPQANATRRLGITMDPNNPIATASEAVAANAEGVGEDATVPCGWTNDDGTPTTEAQLIDVIPSRIDLSNRESEAGAVGAIRRLQKALAGEWLAKYDVVLIDTRPSLGHLVQMAMAASDHVILVTDPMFDGVDGALKVANFVSEHAVDMHNPNLKVSAVLVARYKGTAENRYQVEGLKEAFGDRVWALEVPATRKENGKEVPTVIDWIPEWTRFSEADGAGVSLSAWTDKKGRAPIQLFDVLAERVIREFVDVELAA